MQLNLAILAEGKARFSEKAGRLKSRFSALNLKTIVTDPSVLALLVVFLGTFFLELYTPVHSDDYLRYNTGLGFDKFIEFYLGWGGGVICYWFQVVLAQVQHSHQIVLSVMVAGLATLYLYLIARLPARILKVKFNPYIFLSVAAFYFLFNPNLGQTTFWLVGMTAYLIPQLFAIAFLNYLFEVKDSVRRSQMILLVTLGVCVGLYGAPPLPPTLVYVFIALLFYFHAFKLAYSRRLMMITLGGLVLGAAIMILAPGNYVRMAEPEYAGWGQLSLWGKILEDIKRFSAVYDALLYPFLIYVVSLGYLYLQDKSKAYVKLEVLSLIFLSAFFVVHCTLVFAPYLHPRVLNFHFFFLLIALALVLYACAIFFSHKKVKLLLLMALALVSLYKWVITFNSYTICMEQDAIRNEIIRYEKHQHGQEAVARIPTYYFVNLLSWRDAYDMWFSPDMKKYFGVKEIYQQRTGFDYSLLRSDAHIYDGHFSNSSPLQIDKVLIRNTGFLNPNTSVVLVCRQHTVPSDFYLTFVDRRTNQKLQGKLEGPLKYFDSFVYGLNLGAYEFDYFEILAAPRQ